MLAIRLQRTGRKGHAQYRVIVQDARRTPTSGKIVALLGHYNPHTKESVIEKDKAAHYLKHGAQPSDRVVTLLKAEGVTLPKWVKAASTKQRTIRNTEKLRRNRPPEAKEEEKPEEAPAETSAEEPKDETPAEVEVEAPIEETETDTQPEPAPSEESAQPKAEETDTAEKA